MQSALSLSNLFSLPIPTSVLLFSSYEASGRVFRSSSPAPDRRQFNVCRKIVIFSLTAYDPSGQISQPILRLHSRGTAISLSLWKKKWSHLDLKSWVTAGTKIRHRNPSNWRIFKSNWLNIENQLNWLSRR